VAGGDGYIIDQNAQRVRLNPQTRFLNVMEHNHDERHGTRYSLVEVYRNSEACIISIFRVPKYWPQRLLFDTEDGGIAFLRNV
jgi:hypothetical protein